MRDDALPRHYRTRPGNRRFLSILAVAFAAFFLTTWLDVPRPGWMKLSITVLMSGAVGFGLYARSRRFTAVDGEGISVSKGIGVRRLAWDDLHDIRVVAVPQSSGGVGPRTTAYAYRADGRRVLLPCVDDLELVAVEREVSGLRSLLERQRRADWVPVPGAEARIGRQTACGERAYRWCSGWRSILIGAVITGLIIGCAVFVSAPGGS